MEWQNASMQKEFHDQVYSMIYDMFHPQFVETCGEGGDTEADMVKYLQNNIEEICLRFQVSSSDDFSTTRNKAEKALQFIECWCS